ncbi:MAG TPA: hypothetical protein VKX46_00905, partial [Ktedonobacteraceae bacterium]|nr:hypothetical protein [Ktedonobacteraceae bacterium]
MDGDTHALQRTIHHFHSAVQAAATGLSPQELWKLYNLPGLDGGAGQLIAEVIDGDIPTIQSDLQMYSQHFGLPACSVANGCLT